MISQRLIPALRAIIVVGLMAAPLIVFIVTDSLFFPFITGKAFTFRILIEILFAIWLILLCLDRRYWPKRSLVLYGILVLVTILSLATIFGVNPYRSFWSNFERMDGLISYLHLLAYFLIITSVFTTAKQWQTFFNTSIGVSLVVATYAVLQLAGKFSISQGGARADATLGNASYLAVYMLLHVFLAAWLWYENRQQRWLGFVYGPIILLELTILYHTATRGAILGFLGGVLLTAILIVIRGREHRIVRRISLAILIIIILTAGSFLTLKDSSFIKSNPVLSRFANISLKESTTVSRLTIWQMALRGFAERPILGWGPENFLVVFNKYYEPKLWPQEAWFDRSHNIFVDWLVHAGALGLLAYLSLFAAGLYYIRRYGGDTVTKALFCGLFFAYSIHNFFVFDNLVSLLLLFSFLAYLHYLKTSQHPAGQEAVFPRPAFKSYQWAIVLLVAAGLTFSVYWVNVRSVLAARDIVYALSARDVSVRQAAFERALSRKSLGGREVVEQWLLSGFQVVEAPALSPESKQRYLSGAISSAEEMLRRFPDDARINLFVGALLNRAAQSAEAIKYLEEAKKLSPQKQLILTELAQTYLMKGDQKTALALAEQAFRSAEEYQESRIIYSMILILADRLTETKALWPDGPPPDSRLINAYIKTGHYQEVLALWQKKVKNEPDNVQNRFSLAATFLAIGNRVQAIAELNEAFRINPQVKSQVDFLITEIRAGRNPLAD